MFPVQRPVWVRVSATDWVDGSGWDVEPAITFAHQLNARAVLYNPRWPWHAPPQYWRSQPREFKDLFAGFKFGAR